MPQNKRVLSWPILIVSLGVLFILACAPAAQPPPAAPKGEEAAKPAAAAPAKPAEAKPAAAAPNAMPLDELYEKAKAEGGSFQCYCVMATVNATKFFPVFEQRFPGIKVEQIDATADKLVARIIAEARGGKTLADTFQGGVDYVVQLNDQKLLLETTVPEAAAYPDNMKGSYWVASDLIFIIAAWNTNLVSKAEEPKEFDDFADPRWKGRLMAEPRDLELLMALSQHKFKSEEKGVELIKKIAANAPEFHSGHSELAELLVAGQGAVCLTCYSHHYPPRIAKGAPVNYMLTEGIGTILGSVVMKDAPHPHTAMLFHRWFIGEEGQQALAQAGRTPAHPKVQPLAKTRPEKIYPIAADDVKLWPKYEATWKEIFGLR
jgi:iron(III) transport system substrate-binding protein